MATKAEFEKELARTKDDLIILNTKFEEFKLQVRDKAIEVADDQGWCGSGLNETLEELGLRKVASSMRRKVTIEVEYEWEESDGEPSIGGVQLLDTTRYAGRLTVSDWGITKMGDMEEIYD